MYHNLWVMTLDFSISEGWCIMPKMSQSGWNIYVHQNIIVNVSKCLKPLVLDRIFKIVNAVMPQSF